MASDHKTPEEKLELLGEALRKGVKKTKPVAARQIAREAVEKSQERVQKPNQRTKRRPRLG